MIYRQLPAHAPRAPSAANAPLHAPLHAPNALYAHARPPLHCAVLSGSRLSFGGCAQPSGYLVPALDPFRICIWCTIHYLEMQYLVQRDKGCELRHKGSVSPMAAAVRR